jgi:hypothetical protein
MKFEYTEVWGFTHALRGMRNPKESWDKSDSKGKVFCDDSLNVVTTVEQIGTADLKLAQSLIRAGSEHRKFMRQIFVSVDITAPLYWWKEFDTYKVGTVTNSTSTMHKLASTPITKDCFEMGDFNKDIYSKSIWEETINNLEWFRTRYLETKDKRYWKELIRLLPESWLQKRTVTMDYENLLAICSKGQRRFHKLTEWSKAFIDWARTLPYAQELIFIDKEPRLDFIVKYEDGTYKCKYSSGEEFESLDGVTWTETL